MSNQDNQPDPFHNAISCNDIDAIRDCVNRGEHIGWSHMNMTPLMYAAYSGSDAAVSILVQAGVDLDECYRRDPSARVGSFEYAPRHDGFTALHFAIFYKNAEAALALARAGADLSVRSSSGWTPLEFAKNRLTCILDALREFETGKDED